MSDVGVTLWRPIPGWPYEASIEGLVRHVGKSPLVPGIGRGGYRQVTLHRDGKQHCGKVHQLVCAAFNGPRPSPEHEAAHDDGSRANNGAYNLRWATAKQNHADKRIHGTHLEGERHPRALLTRMQVDEIRVAHAAAMGSKYVRRGTVEMLAARYGVGRHVIKDIVQRRCWQ